MSIFMNKTIDVSDHRHIFAKSGRVTPIVLVGFGVFEGFGPRVLEALFGGETISHSQYSATRPQAS